MRSTWTLFAASELTWERAAGPVKVRMDTAMPYDGRGQPDLRLRPAGIRAKNSHPALGGWDGNHVTSTASRSRPGAAPAPMSPCKNAGRAATRVEFTLPFAWKLTRYEGAEQVEGCERYAYEYGPLLMAFKGQLDTDSHITIRQTAGDLPAALLPAGQPLHFALSGQPEIELVPYLEITPGDELYLLPVVCRVGEKIHHRVAEKQRNAGSFS